MIKYGWYYENSGSGSYYSSIGQMLPNELGLYDMSGNVAECTWDYDYPIETGKIVDYHDDVSGPGNWGNSYLNYMTDFSAGGSWLDPGYAGSELGFRVARRASSGDSVTSVAVSIAPRISGPALVGMGGEGNYVLSIPGLVDPVGTWYVNGSLQSGTATNDFSLVAGVNADLRPGKNRIGARVLLDGKTYSDEMTVEVLDFGIYLTWSTWPVDYDFYQGAYWVGQGNPYNLATVGGVFDEYVWTNESKSGLLLASGMYGDGYDTYDLTPNSTILNPLSNNVLKLRVRKGLDWLEKTITVYFNGS